MDQRDAADYLHILLVLLFVFGVAAIFFVFCIHKIFVFFRRRKEEDAWQKKDQAEFKNYCKFLASLERAGFRTSFREELERKGIACTEEFLSELERIGAERSVIPKIKKGKS